MSASGKSGKMPQQSAGGQAGSRGGGMKMPGQVMPQRTYNPTQDFYGPQPMNGRLMVRQPLPGYYDRFPAPGTNFSPPPQGPVIPDPTPPRLEKPVSQADRDRDAIINYFATGGDGAPIGPEDFGYYRAPQQNMGRGRQQIANRQVRRAPPQRPMAPILMDFEKRIRD